MENNNNNNNNKPDENPKTSLEKLVKGIKNNSKRYFVDTITQVTTGNPIWAIYETQALGMDLNVSFNSKINGSLLCFAGLGYGYSRFRDMILKVMKVTKDSSKSKKRFFDAVPSFVYCCMTAPWIYAISGERDIHMITKATVSAGIGSIVMGLINGPAIDAARDLTGINKPPKILPELVYNAPKSMRHAVGLSLAVLSAAGTYAYYKAIGM